VCILSSVYDLVLCGTGLRSSLIALDGGTCTVVFLLSFVVQGAVGKAHLFPKWWGANHNGNYDRCAAIQS
jgi:hypothetical protein